MKMISQSIESTQQNRTLTEVLQQGRISTVEWTIDLLRALLRSRLNSHEIHGQIAPDRILIISEAPLYLKILPTDNIGADPEFSAPEILDGKTSQSSDIYSIGLIAIYLLTETRPFQLFDTANRCWVWQDYWQRSIQTEIVKDRQLVAILDRSIDLDATARFNSAREMLAAIDDCYPHLLPTPASWYCQHTLTGHHGLFAAIKAIAISPHLPIVATASEDKTIRLWDINTGREIAILTGHQKSVETIAFHPHHSGLLYSGDRNGIIKLWRVIDGEELNSIDTRQSKINALAISTDAKLLISAGSDKTIEIWYLNLTNECSIDYLVTLKHHRLSVNSIAFNPIDSDIKFASVSSDRYVMLWGLESKTPLSILTAHTQAVKTLAFSPDGKLLATAGDDGLIQIWDIDNRQLTQTLSAHSWTISGLSFSIDGNILISASWDGNLKLWQVSTWQEIESISTHSAEILAMKICHHGQYIVTGSRDRTAKIYVKTIDRLLVV
jgi:serine/threonine protein kinase